MLDIEANCCVVFHH